MAERGRESGSFIAASILLAGLVAMGLALPAASAAQPDFPPEDLKFFETHVRPLLAAKCFKCHGVEKQQGGLRLDARARVLAGGDSGAAIAPGKPADSLLLQAVRYESLEMPPDGRLTAEQVAVLEQWIARGAPWPKEASTEVAAEAAGPAVRRSGEFTEEDRQWWALQPLVRPAVPQVPRPAEPQVNDAWVRTPVDAFVLARLHAAERGPAPEADRATLIRRATFDLWGLPPTPEEIEAFLSDDAPDSYERLIDRLLASPRYGERFGRHWLDLVRYADSNGHKSDEFRPDAWQYRDWVIAALNSDMPYDRFVSAQLAGDELADDDPSAVVATGFLRHMPYESNQINVPGQWADLLNDITDVTADVFLGLGYSCARCHDHKYDPILQRDYYRLQAFFAAVSMPVEAPPVTVEQRAQHARWLEKTADVRRRIAELEASHRRSLSQAALNRFPPEMQALIARQAEALDPLQQQWVALATRQVNERSGELPKRMKADAAAAEWETLCTELARFDGEKPRGLPSALVVTDIGPIAPPTRIPGRRNAEPVEPGYLTLLWPEPATIDPLPAMPHSTGRRTALARWLTRPDHPLTTRVIVNRLWQFHFGAGIARTPNDFGRQGESPTHPELLDYLATELPVRGWSLKAMHRLIMTSAVYRQTSRGEAARAAAAVDAENRLLGRMRVRRLDAEQIRDGALAVAGELDLAAGGPAVALAESSRRSIYGQVKRNAPDEMLEVFDAAESFRSVATRNTTTTATQSLLLVNGPWMLVRAERWAKSLAPLAQSDQRAAIARAYRQAYGRLPTDEEAARAAAFLREQTARAAGSAPAGGTSDDAAWQDFCHALLNSNGFLYVE